MVETAKKFKKYFFNDARVGRGNKSHLLNNELTQVQNRIELIRAASLSTSKKLAQSMQTHGQADFDKRQTRLTENGLAKTMSEACKPLLNENEASPAFGQYLNICAKAQFGLAQQKALYEVFLDEQVISPLQNLADTEIPGIYKQRDRLKKLTQDRDKADKALEQARSTASFPPAKIDAMKDEADEAASRCQQCKDQFITEIFEYLSKEAQHAQRIADLYSKQLEYHQKCAQILENLKPELDNVQDQTTSKQSFGVGLSEHLQQTGRVVALPLEACVVCLLNLGLKEEGIFRLAGGAGKLRMMKLLLDAGVVDLPHYDLHEDIHAVAGALKQYLRELPQPLLTHDLCQDWLHAASISEHEQKLREIWTIIDRLPNDNKNNLKYLMKFCRLVYLHEEFNKMSAHNLSLVLSPNLLWSDTDDMNQSMLLSSSVGNVIESIITYCDYFFPEEIDFVLTPNLAASYQSLLDNPPSNPSESLYSNTEAIFSSSNSPGESPVSPTHPLPGKLHLRSWSSDHNIFDSLRSSLVAKPTKKLKSKAPAPPPQTSASNSNEQTKSYSANEKPPIATKRSLTKKPQGPPPNPPNHENTTPEEAVPKPRAIRSNGAGKKPPLPEKPLLLPSRDANADILHPEDTPPPPEDWLTPSEPSGSPRTEIDTEGNVFTAL